MAINVILPFHIKVYAAKLIWENYKNMKAKGQRRKSIYPTGKVNVAALQEEAAAEGLPEPAAPAPGEDAEIVRSSRAGDRKIAEVAPPPTGIVNEGAAADEDWC